MSSEIAIRVEGLGKCYQLGRRQGGGDRFRYDRFSDAVITAASAPFRWLQAKSRDTTEMDEKEFWALKNVSFEVKEGEVLGIIGRNGAGKSTLLKVLSRITEPTRGRIDLMGRVASLLEVGTGFHPELTGRENIYLNGAILGMRHAEIRRRFDEIVAFADVDRFLDTPVKRYSSGMYVRLAFAVAAHLEPEILVVDEVLAVGDAIFQKKCLGKMREVASNEGRTVLFVSHSLSAITSLCPKCMLLERGAVTAVDRTELVMRKYLAGLNTDLATKTVRSEQLDFSLSFAGRPDHELASFVTGQSLTMELKMKPKRRLNSVDVTLAVFSMLGQRVLTFDTRYQKTERFTVEEPAQIDLHWPKNILCPGDYVLGVGIYENGQYLTGSEDISQFRIDPSDYYHTGRLPDSGQGHIMTDADWVFRTTP